MSRPTKAKKKIKRRRNIKPVAQMLKILDDALEQVEEAISELDSADMQLEEAKDKAQEASSEAEGVAQVLRERIEKLKYGARTKRAKKG